MKINFKDVIIPTITLLIICVIAGAALGFSNIITKDKILENENQKLSDAMQNVLPADEYKQIEIDGADDGTALYNAISGGNKIGYTALCTKTGYGGNVKVMVGIELSGTVKNVAIVSADDETPGLGQNIKTDEFLSRFIGINDTVAVDAWTGATISSNAVKDAVTEALSLAKTYGKEQP